MKSPSRLIKAADMRSMSWKNGGGTTTEVAISPLGSSIAQVDFDWRVSIATVASDGPFSLFPGYDRTLVVWHGDGLRFDDIVREPLQPFSFSGDVQVSAQIMSGPVRDFGVIFKRDRFQCQMATHRLQEGEDLSIAPAAEIFVFCARGEVRVGEFYLNPGDVVHASGEVTLAIKALESSSVIVTSIRS